MRTAYQLYQVDFVKHSNRELTISATNRRGKIFVAELQRTDERYWQGYTDFRSSDYKNFKAIVLEFLQDLVQEAKHYDNRWYNFNSMVRCAEGGSRPLTWEETAYGSLVKEDEPVFKGHVKFKTN